MENLLYQFQFLFYLANERNFSFFPARAKTSHVSESVFICNFNNPKV